MVSQKRSKCPVNAEHIFQYNAKYDEYFCPICDIWTEPVRKCKDPNCTYCKLERPEKPSMG